MLGAGRDDDDPGAGGRIKLPAVPSMSMYNHQRERLLKDIDYALARATVLNVCKTKGAVPDACKRYPQTKLDDYPALPTSDPYFEKRRVERLRMAS